MVLRLSARELRDRLSSGVGVDDFATEIGNAIVVDPPIDIDELRIPPLLPCVVVLSADTSSVHPVARAVDVTATGDALQAVLTTVDRNPRASSALALLLRLSEQRSVSDGLMAESTTYGVLQAGPEFARWRAAHPARNRIPPSGHSVSCRADW